MNSELKIQKHKDICDELTKIYTAKNIAYGDAFAVLRREVPTAILVRLFDKYSRLKNLVQLSPEKLKQQTKDESIDDTLKDMANYCIMELIERRMQ